MYPIPFSLGELSVVDCAHDIKAIRHTRLQVEQRLNEKYNVDESTARFLASVIREMQRTDLGQMDHSISFRDLRLEEPLLSSDPDMDTLRLHIQRDSIIAGSMMMSCLPLVYSEYQNVIPPQEAYIPDIDREIRNEKFDIGLPVMEYLKDVIHSAHSDPLAYPKEYWKPRQVSPESSPIRTLSALHSSSEDLIADKHVSRFSTPENFSNISLTPLGSPAPQKALSTLARSASLANTGCTPDLSMPVNNDVIPHSNLTYRALENESCHTSDLMTNVDVSSMFDTEPHCQDRHCSSVHGSQDSDQILPVFTDDTANTQGPDSRNIPILESASIIYPDDVRTTAKVPVPEISDLPSWLLKQTCFHPNQEMLQKNQGLTQPILPSPGRVFPMEMRRFDLEELDHHLMWSPFPAYLGKVDVVEDLGIDSDDGLLRDANLHSQIDFKSLGCMPRTLQLLKRRIESADGICSLIVSGGSPRNDRNYEQCASQETTMLAEKSQTPEHGHDRKISRHSRVDSAASISMEALLKKRKRELEVDKHEEPTPLKATRVNGLGSSTGNRGLSTFLQLQGRSTNPPIEPNSIEADPTSCNSPNPDPTPLELTPSISIPTSSFLQLPAPAIQAPNKPYASILSSRLMSNLEFIRTLHSHLPNLDLISREPSSAHPQHTEADIILSPSSGILLTTLQELKQKPLPGRRTTHSSIPTLESRIHAASTQFATLYILVASSVISPVPSIQTSTAALQDPLPPSDAAALSSLSSTFAAGNLPTTTVQVLYTGSNSASVSARWVAALVSLHSPSFPDTGSYSDRDDGRRAIEDAGLEMAGVSAWTSEETVAERVLRRLGLNAFAALVVLGEMGDDGLAGFLAMGAGERIGKFGGVVGGEVALSRMAVALEKWDWRG